VIHCLAIGAHPDDVELFAGGLLARCIDQGYEAGILHLTRGERSTRGSPEERQSEAINAAKALGVSTSRVRILDLGDTLLENTEANRLEIIRVLRDWCPRVVLYHSPQDRHPDHRKASQLIRDTLFYSRVQKIETGQEPFAPTAGFQFFNTSPGKIPPSFIVDITDTFERKTAALDAYRSQFHNPDYGGRETYISSKEFREQIEIRSRYFGGLVGVRHGEPYYSVGPLPLTDPIALFGPSGSA
jgi:bacillithiol biosynthesis deacetylase BshB1